MKSLAISIVLALGVSAPALAQQATNPPADAGAAQPAEPSPDEILIDDATTPEGRMAMLLRCSGPPPRPIASTAPAKEAPASEPATVAERATPSNGG